MQIFTVLKENMKIYESAYGILNDSIILLDKGKVIRTQKKDGQLVSSSHSVPNYIGDDELECWNAIKEVAPDSRLSPCVTFKGSEPLKEIIGYLKESDVDAAHFLKGYNDIYLEFIADGKQFFVRQVQGDNYLIADVCFHFGIENTRIYAGDDLIECLTKIVNVLSDAKNEDE